MTPQRCVATARKNRPGSIPYPALVEKRRDRTGSFLRRDQRSALTLLLGIERCPLVMFSRFRPFQPPGRRP